VSAPDLSVELAGVPLRNPVLVASGTAGYGSELEPLIDLRALGGLVTKSLTLEPRQGNPPPRIAETPAGMLNAISLENIGVRAFIEQRLPRLPAELAVFCSVFETEIDRYAEVCKRLDGAAGVRGLELNASCPHVQAGGIEFGQDPRALASLVRACRRATALPLLAKLSPNVTSIAEMARVCEGEGADGLSLINTLQGMAVDVERRRPVLANLLGGLSGPAIRPVALRMVWQAARAVRLPICGIGGIVDADDAVAFLLCGATAVQVGTATYLDPRAALRVRDGLAAYLKRHQIGAVRELIGALEGS
jgi:dihydroorotate dehydrogenase (NAD+) catalytic subunit